MEERTYWKFIVGGWCIIVIVFFVVTTIENLGKG